MFCHGWVELDNVHRILTANWHRDNEQPSVKVAWGQTELQKQIYPLLKCVPWTVSGALLPSHRPGLIYSPIAQYCNNQTIFQTQPPCPISHSTHYSTKNLKPMSIQFSQLSVLYENTVL